VNDVRRQSINLFFTLCLVIGPVNVSTADTHPTGDDSVKREVYFGELHVHSANSYDSYFNSVRVSPEEAYRFARGEKVNVGGFDAQLRIPLDFMAVTDHAMFLGVFPTMGTEGTELSQLPSAARFNLGFEKLPFLEFYNMLFPGAGEEPTIPPQLIEDSIRNTWKTYPELAKKYYDPGTFTTLVGYEYTAAIDAQGLHRNVIFRDTDVPAMPFSSVDSVNPEDLWAWMDRVREEGHDSLAIPHNPNQSNGLMFALSQWDGSPLDRQWAELRMRNEPLVEITQIKGTSETSPQLSPTDEFAAFEIMDERMGTNGKRSMPQGSYVRDAFKRGISLESENGFNPYKIGVIGSTDGHNSVSPVDEDSYSGKMRGIDHTPQLRRDGGSGIARHNWMLSASGLTGVWAAENTRQEIFDALRRKEVFATSGPRIKVRMFAGWDFPSDLLSNGDWVETAYASGVPMGGDIASSQNNNDAPQFIVYAMKDPASAWLQRIQIIKGWVDQDGNVSEKVVDVVCSDGGVPDSATDRCPDNNALVDLHTCDISNDKGDVSLAGVWEDPEFDATQHAFYYARVVENPTCRWTTWEAIRAGWDLLDTVSPIIQERAWTSPVWYSPGQ